MKIDVIASQITDYKEMIHVPPTRMSIVFYITMAINNSCIDL